MSNLKTLQKTSRRHTSQQGLDLIKKFESFSANIYMCPAGYPTIGYGHVVKESEIKSFKGGITRAQAEDLLEDDVQTAQAAVLRYINIPLTQGQFDALVSFTFNLGAGALQRSTLRRKINREEHDVVPAEFMKWVWANGKKLNGLKLRRTMESNFYQNAFLFS